MSSADARSEMRRLPLSERLRSLAELLSDRDVREAMLRHKPIYKPAKGPYSPLQLIGYATKVEAEERERADRLRADRERADLIERVADYLFAGGDMSGHSSFEVARRMIDDGWRPPRPPTEENDE